MLAVKRQSGPIGVVHYGLGPIGLMVADLVSERLMLRSCAAIDVDPQVQGRALNELLSQPRSGTSPRIVNRLSDADTNDAAVAVHCTGSSLRAVMPQLLELVDAGLNVVSTCEELSYPWSAWEYAEALDKRAKEHQVSVLGAGINPGFAMDYLPIVLSGVLRRVDSVHVKRVQNAATRRLPLQAKVGVGMAVDEFRAKVMEHKLGHVGLRQSADALAEAFGWSLDGYSESIRPVVARAVTPSGMGDIPVGRSVGLRQIARGRASGELVIELDLTIAIGARGAQDKITLVGDTVLEARIPGGLHGDTATAALVVNSISRIWQAEPGLVTMEDLAPPHPWQRPRVQSITEATVRRL